MVDRLYLVIAVLLSLVISFDGSPRKVIFDKWSGNITSNPGNKYLKNQEYEWLIKVPVGGKFIELKFPAFLTECLYDYVSVYNNNDEDNRLQLAAISGNLRSMEDIVSDTGQMYIHLTSDADRVFRGFKATFSVTICPNNCTGSNGRCNPNSNKCTCNAGWYGDKCDKGALDCGSHGQLDTLLNKCRCNEGYFGWKCNIKLISKAEEPPYNSWFSLVQPESRQSILSWDQAKRMLPRQGHTADVIGDYLYVFGGYDLNLVLYSFKRLHVVSGDWSDVPISPASSSLPGGRYMHSSAVFGDSILYCGGFFKSTTTIGGDCWLYNTSDSCWYQYPSLPVPVTGHTTTVVPAGNVYLFGGLTGGDTDHYSCSLHTMDLSSRSPVWGLVTPTIYKCSEIRRYGHSAVYDEDSGSIVVFGGFVPIPHVRYDKSSDVLLFSIKNKVWSKLKITTQIPGIVFHTAVKLGRFMVVFGGNKENQNVEQCFNPDTIVFDLGCMDWVSPLPKDESHVTASLRYAHAAARYRGSMVVVGGFNGQPMNDVLLYYPPREDCSSIPNKDKKGGEVSSAAYDECNALQHCVRCGKKCRPVKRCRQQMNQCSVCYRLTRCTECALAGCEWCVQDGNCRSRNSGDYCGVQSPEPWWGPEGTLLTSPIQCQTDDMPPGLHWVKVVDPVNWDLPDHVSIVKSARVDLLYSKHTHTRDTGEDKRYYGHLRGYINSTHREYSNKYNLRVQYTDGLVDLHVGRTSRDAELVFRNASRKIQKENRYSLPRYKIVYIKAVLSQYINDQQQRSNMTIMWDGGGSDYHSEEILNEDVLVPYRNGSCTHFGTCLGCLTDQLCGWNSSISRCQLRSVHTFSANQKFRAGYLITDFDSCTKCDERITCSACAGDGNCEWLNFRCHRRGRYEEAIRSRYRCPDTCSRQSSCYSCTELDDCVWCKALGRCFSINVQVALYPFGECSVWYNGFVTPGGSSHCDECEMYRTCRECQSVRGCGWCGLESQPHSGTCIKGNFEEGYCSLSWYYQECPAVNECALGLHHCHDNAECIDTEDGFTCQCKLGYQDHDGVCESKCDTSSTCKHGKCSEYNLCECDLGYTGPNCDQDCLCNLHSTCSQGQGICDDCKHMTEGETCQLCTAGAYRTGPGTRSVCNPCQCNGHHDPARGYCDRNTGQCHCTGHTTGFNCELCGQGYYGSAVDGGQCYMVARSRVQLASVADGAVGNVQSERRHRYSLSGYESVMWYITPPLESVSVVVSVNDFKSNAPDTPGVLYIWEGLPAHISGALSSNLTSRLLLLLSADISSSRDHFTRETRDHVMREFSARGAVTVLFEGMQSTKFNISYELRNCTHNCSGKDARFNATCGYGMDCTCVSGHMGPQCYTPVCPDNCNNRGSCVESTGVCRCDESSSGISCSDRSSAQITWSVKSFDWLPPGHVIMGPRMGHSAVVIGGNNLTVYGGYDLYTMYSDIWQFDTYSLTWTQLATAPHTSGASIGASSGASTGASTGASGGEAYPAARYLHSVIVEDNSMCVIGGVTKEGLSSEVWCTSLGGDTIVWTNLHSSGLPPMAGSSAVRYSEETWYLFGGVTESGASNLLYKFSVTKKLWSLVPTSGLVPRMYGHSMILHKDRLHVIGSLGYYKYSVTAHTWVSVPADLPGEIVSSFHSSTQDVGLVYLVGGRSWGVHHLNGGLFALQLDTGSYIQITRDPKTAMISSNLLFLNNKLYLMGGFNGSVHSLVLSYDLRDSICYFIREEEECSRFGCAWCDKPLYSPKPCIPTPILGCKYNTLDTTLPCIHHTDCYSCASNSCYWTSAKTCSSNKSLRTTCNGACKDWSTCTECHGNAQCAWHKDTCTHTSNVVRSNGKRSCPVVCGVIDDCTRCTVKDDCSWSSALETCLSAELQDWFCLFNRCDLLVHPVQCPEPCSLHKTCSVCKEHNQCGWCANGEEGECQSGDVSNPRDSTCANWHYFTCPLEDECALDVHTCRLDQLCVDMEDGYNCTCSNGTVNSDEVDACIPSCADTGCDHGDCVDVGMCVCEYGYHGADCSLKCDCMGHSECAEDGSCLKCEGNTTGSRCEHCLDGFILKGKYCISCKELCYGHSNTCVDNRVPATAATQSFKYLLFERAKCEDCQNNTVGDYCQKCKSPDYFRDPVSGQCRECTCNKHTWKCNPETGLDCDCQNHTRSSYQSEGGKCVDAQNCFLYQCDICQYGYSGDPRNGSSCFQTLDRDKVYNFTGREYFARPFHIPLQGSSDHWVYIEMRDLVGTVYASMNPREYRIYLDEKTRSHGVHHESFYEVHNSKRSARYTTHRWDIKPMKPWIAGVEEIDTQYNYLQTEMNCERRLIKYSPMKHGPNTGIYLIIETKMTGGHLKIQWYVSNTEYNYYLTANLLSSGLILMLVFYYFMTNAINSLIYLWQQRAGRRASVNNRPKCLVSLCLDISDYKHHHLRCKRGYTLLPQNEALPPITPVATQEYFVADVRCGLSTVLIKLPGQQMFPKLMFGTAVFKTGDKSLDFRLATHDEVICETSI